MVQFWSWIECVVNVVYMVSYDFGGYFLVLSYLELWVEDICNFFKIVSDNVQEYVKFFLFFSSKMQVSFNKKNKKNFYFGVYLVKRNEFQE